MKNGVGGQGMGAGEIFVGAVREPPVLSLGNKSPS